MKKQYNLRELRTHLMPKDEAWHTHLDRHYEPRMQAKFNNAMYEDKLKKNIDKVMKNNPKWMNMLLEAYCHAIVVSLQELVEKVNRVS